MKETIYIVTIDRYDGFEHVGTTFVFATKDKKKAERYVERANLTFSKLNSWREHEDYNKACERCRYYDNLYVRLECDIIKTKLV